MTENRSDDGCPANVWRGYEWTGGNERCGKPIKRRGLCGVHARKADGEDERRNVETERQAMRAEAMELAGKLTARFGVSFESTYNGTVTLTLGAARALVAAGVGGADQ